MKRLPWKQIRDPQVAAHVASWSGAPYVRSSLVMEGGSVEVDGEGTAIITRSSVINPRLDLDAL